MKNIITIVIALSSVFIQPAQGAIYQTVNRVIADSIIHANIGNTNFVIIDLRTASYYNAAHIKCAINIDYYASNFSTLIGNLDKTKRYLIYCQSGSRSASTLSLMQTLSFQEVYNLSGGINSWTPYGYPVYNNTVKYHYEDVSVASADTLITAHASDSDFVIIDLRSPVDYTASHIKNAINIDYHIAKFDSVLESLDSSLTYLIYCADGTHSDSTLIKMYDSDFWTVYNMYEGFNQWVLSGYPVDTPIPAPIYRNLTAIQADSLISAKGADTNFVIIDLRSPANFTISHIKNAINIDYNSKSFTTIIGNLDSTNAYLLYCQDGTNSGLTFQLMQTLVFREVYNLLGGLDQWILSGFSVDSMTSVVMELYKKIDLTVYPNPSNGLFNLEINNNTKEEWELEIIDIQGQLVFNEQIDKSFKRIDLSNYPKGLYFIKIENRNCVYFEKIIIQ